MKIVIIQNGVEVKHPEFCYVKYGLTINSNNQKINLNKNQKLKVLGVCGYGYKVQNKKGDNFNISDKDIKLSL